LDSDVGDDLNALHRHHHHGGVVLLVALSLDTLGLPPDQAARVAQIQARLFVAMEPARLAEQEVITLLADGVAAGGIDKAKVDAAVARLEIVSAHVTDAGRDSLNELHAALTPAQRGALADKVRAHWTVFTQTEGTTPGSPSGPTGHLAEVARQVGLSADQIEKVRARLQETTAAAPSSSDAAEVEAELRRIDAFRDDAFDARSLADGRGAGAHMAARGARRMASFYEAIDPQLTPEQRPKLVVILREHATHAEPRGGADVARREAQ
jgi:Spy/CpxP family protein refolding chaperone